MKKLLLGTSALCALAAFGAAPAAQAANEPIKLGFGGYMDYGYGDMLSQSGAAKNNRRTDLVNMDNVLFVTGSTKLDNGLTVGAMIQIRAENRKVGASNVSNGGTGPDTIKRDYAYIRGAFGEFRVGDIDDAKRAKSFGAPVAGSLFGANSPELFISNNPLGTNTTFSFVSGPSRVTELVYFTPTIAGFSFGVSYSPSGTKAYQGGATAPDGGGTTQNGFSNEWSAAGTYGGKFGSFGFDASAGVSSATRDSTGAGAAGRDNPFAIEGSAKVTFGPFAVGGAYEHVKNGLGSQGVGSGRSATGQVHSDTWDVGALWNVGGPFSVSINWSRGLYENLADGGTTSAHLDFYELVGNYALGPGINLGAALIDTHSHSTNGADNYNGLGIMTGLNLDF